MPWTETHEFKHLTGFQRAVFALCAAIPPGRVATYGSIASALGTPRAAQAVGNALRANPFAPEFPCHRVIRADLTLGGYSGATATSSPEAQKKLLLLRGEEVHFDPRSFKLVDTGRVCASVDDWAASDVATARAYLAPSTS